MIPGIVAGRPVIGGGGGGGDPYWADVSSLLHFDGPNGSTTFTDETGKSWSAAGNAQLSTTGPKFGSACGLFDGTGDYISTTSHADFGFGAGDFTIEGWAYRTATGDRCIFDNRNGSSTGIGVYATVSAGGTGGLAVASNTAVMARAPDTTPSASWYHWAVARSGTTLRGFVNGVQELSVTDSRTYASSAPCVIGATYLAGAGFSGRLDEIRITKGVARYTSAFTPPTAPFPNS